MPPIPRRIVRVLLLSTFAAACDCAAEPKVLPVIECEALAAFYHSTGGPGWTSSTGWLQTATPCSCVGVNCGGP